MSGSRREFLRQSSLLLAGVAAACSRKKELPLPPQPQIPVVPQAAPARATLSDMQRKVLDAATARILPTDADPGAHEAGVVEYLDRELARPEMSEVRTGVLAGVVALNRIAAKQGGKLFADLPVEQQDEVLHEVQRGSQRGADFVTLLVSLTLEGVLGDPRYGGNQGLVGWKLSGYGPGEPHHHHG